MSQTNDHISKVRKIKKNDTVRNSVNSVSRAFTVAREELEKQSSEAVEQKIPLILETLSSTLRKEKLYDVLQRKEVLSAIGKLQKSVCKEEEDSLESLLKLLSHSMSLDKDGDELSSAELFSAESIHRSIVRHFYSVGLVDVARILSQECGFGETMKSVEASYASRNRLVAEIRSGLLENALCWAREHRQALCNRRSDLEFVLNKLHFLSIVLASELSVSDRQKAALAYARASMLSQFTSHMPEIQRLLGCIVFIDDLSNSPYAELSQPLRLYCEEAAMCFSRDYSEFCDLAIASPLSVSVGAAFTAIPALKKLATFSERGMKVDQTSLELPRKPEHTFHSIFVCPVAKEQSTADNPPHILPCGHVVLKTTMKSLVSRRGSRLKCPYCPSEATIAQCKPIFL